MALQRDDKIAIGIGAGALLFYFGVLDPLLVMLGIKQSKEGKENDAEAQDPGSPWSANYWKAIPRAQLITAAATDAMIKQIYDAFGFFDDNEEQAIAVFKSIRYQTQLSWLSDNFTKKYSQDLLTFLRGGNWPKDRLSDADVASINAYIKKLPVS